MPARRSKSQTRKPFWERILELFIATMKRMLVPALAIWLIGWLWLGGVFTATKNMMWDGFVNWTASQGFVVEDVVIEGRDKTALSDLQRIIKIKLNDPILSVDVDDIQSRLAKLPWVGDVTVARNYSGIVSVNITERIPFVLWYRHGIGVSVVDTKGEIIKQANPSNFTNLLKIRGVGAPNHMIDLMQNILAEPDVADHIVGAQWIGDRRWDLMTSKNTKIHLPEGDVGYALSRLAKSQAEKNILNRSLLSIDLRAADRIIVETERGQSQDMMNLSAADITNAI